VNPWNKDGIEVKLKLRAEVQIASSEDAREKSVVLKEGEEAVHLIYPYDACEVQKVVERTAVKQNAEDKNLFETDWESAALGSVTGKIKAYIAGQSIDELLRDDKHSPQLSSFTISEELFHSINQGLDIAGSKLLNLQITDFSPIDEEISNDLIKYWEAKEQKYDAIRQGEIDAKRTRVAQRARTYSQQNLLDTLIKNLEELNHDAGNVDPARFTEASLLFLAQTLEQSLDDPLIGAYIARETLETLDKIREQLNI